ncbi:MAG: GyrI-like domain-containing protein [Cytophagaceae bacterium]|nr:GyrI-like domain-containing protein [Cytophagaceae bacterium]
MQPKIKTSIEKKLIGKKIKMSLSDNKTGELWRSFMPSRREIKNNLTTELISMSIYDPLYFKNFNPAAEFEKWAAVEVKDFSIVPEGMETYTLPPGLYAVFFYKGLNTDHSIYQYIFSTWLPASVYLLDDRPHFEILGEKYKNNDPESEEEIWMPVRNKK